MAQGLASSRCHKRMKNIHLSNPRVCQVREGHGISTALAEILVSSENCVQSRNEPPPHKKAGNIRGRQKLNEKPRQH